MTLSLTIGELKVIAETDHVQCGDAAAMARALLAAYEQEPVSGTTFQPVSDLYAISIPGCKEEHFTADAAEASDCSKKGWPVREYVKLERLQSAFTHPTPSIHAVPDEMTKSLVSIAKEYQTTPQNALFIVVGWNACRAAMLNGGAQ